MSKLLAWFSPTRWAILGVAVLALGGGIAWGMHALKEAGRDEIRAEWAAANAQAMEAQGKLNQGATVEHATEAGAAKVIYKTKIQRVVEYVASNQNRDGAGTVVCPADAQFISLYNDTGPAR